MSLAECTAGCFDCDPLAIKQQEITGAGLQKLDNACAKAQIVKIDCGVLDAIPCQGISGEGCAWQSRRAAL